MAPGAARRYSWRQLDAGRKRNGGGMRKGLTWLVFLATLLGAGFGLACGQDKGSFVAACVEVAVDGESGAVKVKRVCQAYECGKILNPMLVAGQIEGSAYMGIAEALMEDHDVNRFGLHAGPSLLDYRIPTSVDTPELHALIVESLDPEGPYGAKEAGEGSLAAFLPALTNAIADATGLRFNDLPVTPDRVFAALEKRARDAGRRHDGDS